MTQDTRKDRRVKIVSLNVRYKSATVDEFIENHAHDVSRGGIYIKTANPFPAGTLLKFEIRLASDQAVIAGVGRVVWKRDSTQTTGERPGGMGVKFIKIDAPSTAVIDKLVNTKSDAGKAFEDEPQSVGEVPLPPPPPAAKGAPVPRASTGPAPPMRKATMMGLGISSSPPPKPATTPHAGTPAPPRPSPAGAVFPKTNPEAEMPPKQEQTVMKQAAELLEEALREAGGSMEDVGTNPLFAGATAAKAASEPTPLPAALAAEGVDPFKDDAAKAKALVAEMAPAQVVEKKPSSAPPQARRTPVSTAPAGDKARASVRPGVGRAAQVSEAPPAPKKSLSGLVVTLVVVAAAAAGVMVFRDTLFGTGPETPAVTPPAAPVPSVSAAAEASNSAAPAMSASAATSASAAASASASAGPATSASAAGSATATATAMKTAMATAAPPPKPTPVATAAPPPAATTTAAPAPAAPKPKPKPKADDNPY